MLAQAGEDSEESAVVAAIVGIPTSGLRRLVRRGRLSLHLIGLIPTTRLGDVHKDLVVVRHYSSFNLSSMLPLDVAALASCSGWGVCWRRITRTM